MYNTTDTTKALTSLLGSREKFISDNVRLVRGGMVNNDPNRTPWAGVYRGKAPVAPRILGSSDAWQMSPQYKIVLQASHLGSYEECEDKLNALVEDVLSCVFANVTIKDTVDMVTDVEVEYGYIDTEVDTLHFQSAIITLTTEVAT